MLQSREGSLLWKWLGNTSAGDAYWNSETGEVLINIDDFENYLYYSIDDRNFDYLELHQSK